MFWATLHEAVGWCESCGFLLAITQLCEFSLFSSKHAMINPLFGGKMRSYLVDEYHRSRDIPLFTGADYTEEFRLQKDTTIHILKSLGVFKNFFRLRQIRRARFMPKRNCSHLDEGARSFESHFYTLFIFWMCSLVFLIAVFSERVFLEYRNSGFACFGQDQPGIKAADQSLEIEDWNSLLSQDGYLYVVLSSVAIRTFFSDTGTIFWLELHASDLLNFWGWVLVDFLSVNFWHLQSCHHFGQNSKRKKQLFWLREEAPFVRTVEVLGGVPLERGVLFLWKLLLGMQVTSTCKQRFCSMRTLSMETQSCRP